jgi:hypothetical protein
MMRKISEEPMVSSFRNTVKWLVNLDNSSRGKTEECAHFCRSVDVKIAGKVSGRLNVCLRDIANIQLLSFLEESRGKCKQDSLT